MRLLSRKTKFRLLHWFVLPIGIVVLKLIVWSYRIGQEDRKWAAKTLAANDRIVFAAWHGSLFSTLPLIRIATRNARKLYIMTSPSRDGLLLDRVLQAFDVEVIKGSTSTRPIQAMRNLIKTTKEGGITIVAVDGPRGPVMKPKPGVVMLARSTNATLFCVNASSKRNIRFNTWDREFLPLPFSRLKMCVEKFDMPEEKEETMQETLVRLKAILIKGAKAVNSPITKDIA